MSDVEFGVRSVLDPLSEIVQDEIDNKPQWAFNRAMEMVKQSKRVLARGSYMSMKDTGDGVLDVFRNNPNFIVNEYDRRKSEYLVYYKPALNRVAQQIEDRADN